MIDTDQSINQLSVSVSVNQYQLSEQKTPYLFSKLLPLLLF